MKERTAQLHSAVASLEEEVAERHRVEHELRVSEERWRNLSELSSDMSYAVAVEPDGSLTLEWITQAISRITGYRIDEINQRGWRSLLHPEDVGRMAPYLSRLLEDETREVEGRIITRDGEVRWLRVHVRGARSPVDGKLRILGAIRDVTEARQAEEEKRRLEAQMLEAQKLESLGILAGGIAHDFNNLLAVILGNQTLAMSEAQEGSRLAKQLDRIRSAAKHAEALAHQMLAYSGKASTSLEPLDLSELVEKMRELLEAAISKKCRLEISLHHERTMVEGDPTQLRQVVMNLVTNASESLHERPGRVAVRTGLVSADAAYLAHTFGGGDLAEGELRISGGVRYRGGDGRADQQADLRALLLHQVRRPRPGARLGARNRAGAPGRHQARDRAGRGNQFPGPLAAVHARRASRAGQNSPAKRPGARGHDPRRRRRGVGARAVPGVSEEKQLRRGDCRRWKGGSGDPSGRRRERTIDAVVLDLTMPDLDGEQTFQQIRTLRPDLPVIVASGFSEEATADRFPPDEIAAFIRKPYEPEDLVDAIRTSLGE